MSEKKLTKRDHFNALLNINAVKTNPELVKFINHELELLTRKNSSERKQTPTQMVNETIKQEIVKCLEVNPNRLYTVSEMLKQFPCCAELSLPKVTNLLGQLIKEDKVKKIYEKRKAYFSLAK